MSVTGVTERAEIAGLHSVLAPSQENVNIVVSQLSKWRRSDYIFSGDYFFSAHEALNRVSFPVSYFHLLDSRERVWDALVKLRFCQAGSERVRCCRGSRVDARLPRLRAGHRGKLFSSCAAAGKSLRGLGRAFSLPGRCPRAPGNSSGQRRGTERCGCAVSEHGHLRFTGSPRSCQPSGALLRTLMTNFCFGRSRLQPREDVSRAEAFSHLLGDANESQGPLRYGRSLLELSDNVPD